MMLISIMNAVFIPVFLVFAALQYNDHDPVRWTSIYLAAAAMCALQFLGDPLHILPPILIVICVIWIATLLPSVVRVPMEDIFASLKMQTEEVEEAREIGGLCIVGLWAAVLAFQ